MMSTATAPAAVDLKRKLGETSYYLDSIENLHKKFSSLSAALLHTQQPEGFTFAQAYMDRAKLSAVIAKSIAKGEYTFTPATLNTIAAGGKMRKVYSFRIIDRIVHGAIYRMIAEDLNRFVSPHVYSYVKGRGKQHAIKAFADFLRRHRKLRRRPQDRGLYVLRCDIKSYGESIPVHVGSALWGQLASVFAGAYGRPADTQESQLLAELIRPVLKSDEGTFYNRLYGIPDGAPISSLLLNLYVAPLDEALSSVSGGFYARYGDDIIFAHPDIRVFQESAAHFDKVLAGLELIRNEKKTKQFFFNGAGRPGGDIKGTTHIEYLGVKLAFDGTAMLKTDKIRDLYKDLTIRAKATASAMAGRSVDERGQALCDMLNGVFDPQSMMAHPSAQLMSGIINDRKQLKQIDYWLARLVLHFTLGDASVKAFRKVPYQKIRNEWKLQSLEYARNQ